MGQRNTVTIVTLLLTAGVTAPSLACPQTWVCPEGKCMLPGDVDYPCPGCPTPVTCECSIQGWCPAQTIECYWYVPPGVCVDTGGASPVTTSVNCSRRKTARQNPAVPDCSLENLCIETTGWYNSGVMKYHTPGQPCTH